MAAEDLAAGIAFDPLGAGVPVDDMSIRIEHVDGVVGDALDQQLETAFRVLELRSCWPQAAGHAPSARCSSVSFRTLQLPFCFPARRDLPLAGLVEARIVDGDGGLRRQGRHDSLGALGENLRLRMTEEESAQHFAGAGDDRNRKIAANRQMALGHAVVGRALAIARIARMSSERTGPRPRKVGSKIAVLRGIGNFSKACAAHPRACRAYRLRRPP